MHVVITGATGFIGRSLCQELIDHGDEVTAIIRPESQKKGKIPQGAHIIELTLDELYKLKGSYDLFYHLAWNGSSGEARNDFDVQYTNVKYTAEAIRVAKNCGCKKIIGAGSQAEYGLVRGICKEDTNPNPFMMYGAAKLASYHMGKVLAEQLGISFVWPRIYSVYGVGENEGTLISYVIKTLMEEKAPVLTSCENMWDFMYITDCTRALRLLGEKDECNGIYNVSSGNPRLLKQFLQEIRDVVCKEVKLDFGAKQTDLTKTVWLEPDVKRMDEIGFKATVTFEDGIRQIINTGVK